MGGAPIIVEPADLPVESQVPVKASTTGEAQCSLSSHCQGARGGAVSNSQDLLFKKRYKQLLAALVKILGGLALKN